MSGEKLIDFPQSLDYHQIVQLVPYRSPWLLIDRVLRWDHNSIMVEKAISGADPMMAAHLSEGPSIMPGVLFIELVGQATMLLGVLSSGGKRGGEGAAVLARCKGTFSSPGYIGEVITAEVSINDEIAGKTVYEGVVNAGNRLVCRVSGIGAMVTSPMSSIPVE